MNINSSLEKYFQVILPNCDDNFSHLKFASKLLQCSPNDANISNTMIAARIIVPLHQRRERPMTTFNSGHIQLQYISKFTVSDVNECN